MFFIPQVNNYNVTVPSQVDSFHRYECPLSANIDNMQQRGVSLDSTQLKFTAE
jgi:hypothetical protein